MNDGFTDDDPIHDDISNLISDNSDFSDESDEDFPVRKICCCTIDMYNVLVMSFSFLGLFIAFNPLQRFFFFFFFPSLQSTTQTGNTGYIGIAVLYGVIAATTLVSSGIVKKMGEKLSLILGASSYVLYIFVLLLMIKVEMSSAALQAMYYSINVVTGVGGFFFFKGSVLWTAQGSLVALSASKKTLGLFNGIFFCVFMVNYLVGGIITQNVLNKTEGGQTLLYIIFTILGCVSWGGFFFIRPTSRGLILLLKKKKKFFFFFFSSLSFSLQL